MPVCHLHRQAFHPLFLGKFDTATPADGTEETEHANYNARLRLSAESLQTALKRLGFYHGRIDLSAFGLPVTKADRHRQAAIFSRHAAFSSGGSA